MLFKVGAVPFHFWSPDVYEGSPVLVTSFMSTLGKVASFVAFYKLFSTCFLGSKDLYEYVLTASIIATIIVANFSALRQDSMRRLLAFSGIVNAGYMLMAILLVSFDGNPSSLFYFSLAYILSSFAVFSSVLYVFEATGKDDIESFRGLAKSSPVMAAILLIGLLSMAGLPPFAGFLAKYYLFSQAINMGYVWLAFFAIVFSAVSVYYYLKVTFVLYSQSENTFQSPSKIYLFVGVIAVVFLILAGILPDFLLV
jgi:NADH-quinone oxidoreductase subunit N